MNKVFLSGRLTKDVDYTITGSGQPICKFIIAVSANKTKTDFFSLTAFGKTAENINKFFKKGSPIEIEGHLANDTYAKENKGIFRDNIIADSFFFPIPNKDFEQRQEEVEKKENEDAIESLDFNFSESDLPF